MCGGSPEALDVPYWEIATIVCCLAFSVLFSGSETALNALGSNRLQKLLERSAEDKRRNRFLELWHSRRNEALTCILIGNNLVNIAASALVTDLFTRLFAPTEYASFAVPAAIFVATISILTLGEIIPKTFAQNNAERFAALAVLLTPFFVLTYPVNKIFTGLSLWFIRKTGGRVKAEVHPITEEDIEDHIAAAAAQGNLDQDQQRLLESVFEFDDTIVRDVMKPRPDVIGLALDAPLQQVLNIIEQSGHSRYPVHRGELDDVAGMLYVRDLLAWFARPQSADLDINDFLRPALFVPETKGIRELLRELQSSRVHLAMVVDEFGSIAGLVTIEDIVEEVFGEIYDETDAHAVGEDLVRSTGDDLWEADGRVSVRDVEEALGVDIFPDDEAYSTIAGYVLTEAGKIPEKGWTVILQGYRFRVVEADMKSVTRVEIQHIPATATEDESTPEPAAATG